MRALIKLAIVAVVVLGAVRVGSVFWRFYQFEDKLQEIAQFGDRRTDKQLCGKAMDAATRYDVPISEEAITISRGNNPGFNCAGGYRAAAKASNEPPAKINIEASYQDQLPILPGYNYPWEMKAAVSAWVRP